MPTSLIITLQDDGKLNVNGPLHNPLMCYGMLEIAKDVIRAHAQKQESRVKLAPTIPPHFGPIGGGGN